MADEPTLMRDPQGNEVPVQGRHVDRQKARGWSVVSSRKPAKRGNDADTGDNEE